MDWIRLVYVWLFMYLYVFNNLFLLFLFGLHTIYCAFNFVCCVFKMSVLFYILITFKSFFFNFVLYFHNCFLKMLLDFVNKWYFWNNQIRYQPLLHQEPEYWRRADNVDSVSETGLKENKKAVVEGIRIFSCRFWLVTCLLNISAASSRNHMNHVNCHGFMYNQIL